MYALKPFSVVKCYQRMASGDGHESKLEKFGPSVSSFDAMPTKCKNYQKNVMVSAP